jgi:uncharacterized repeat protein (TIGR02543 family)
VDGSAYAYLVFDYFGSGDVAGSYNTDVTFYADSSETEPFVYLWLNDNSDSSALDAGSYELDPGSGGAGTVDDVFIVGTVDYSVPLLRYGASVQSEEDFSGELDIEIGTYDQIISGSVDISESNGIYTFEWSFGTADGDTLAGSYTGKVDSGDIPDDDSEPVEPDFFYVLYDGNGHTSGAATVPSDTTPYEQGQIASVLGPGEMTREGHEFSGWNTAPAGNATPYDAEMEITIDSTDITLYAQWSELTLDISFTPDTFESYGPAPSVTGSGLGVWGITLSDSSLDGANRLGFTIVDSDSTAVPLGTYVLASDRWDESAGDFFWPELAMGGTFFQNGQVITADFVASDDTEEVFLSTEGNPEIGAYVQILGGEIRISSIPGALVYTVVWEFQTTAGTISGSYSGDAIVF